MALVNKSLLRRDTLTGRYEIHELLRQYGEEQLSASSQESEHIHNRHCDYFASYMRQQWFPLLSLRQGVVLDEIGVEFTNILEAWNCAVAKCRVESLDEMMLTLWAFYDLGMPHPEGAELFRRAVAALEAVPPDKETET